MYYNAAKKRRITEELMKDLKCGLRECKYNKGYCCCSKSITVSGRTDCTTYAPDDRRRRVEFEAANDFVPANYNVDTLVKCDANCIYNSDGGCTATGITVMGGAADSAKCLTFIRD